MCVCTVKNPHFSEFNNALGTLEVGGLTPIQAIEIVRGLRGLNIIGGDVAEVS